MGEQRPQIQRPTSAPKPTNAFLTKPNCPWNPICPLAERLRLRLDVFAINVTQQDVTSRRMRHLSMPGQASPSCESSHVLHDRGPCEEIKPMVPVLFLLRTCDHDCYDSFLD